MAQPFSKAQPETGPGKLAAFKPQNLRKTTTNVILKSLDSVTLIPPETTQTRLLVKTHCQEQQRHGMQAVTSALGFMMNTFFVVVFWAFFFFAIPLFINKNVPELNGFADYSPSQTATTFRSSAVPVHKDHNCLLSTYTLSQKGGDEEGHVFQKGVVELTPNL